MNLRNATALVTGGSSGIGLAIAKVLIDAGTRVAISGRDEKKLYKAAEMLNAVPIRADVTNEADVTRLSSALPAQRRDPGPVPHPCHS